MQDVRSHAKASIAGSTSGQGRNLASIRTRTRASVVVLVATTAFALTATAAQGATATLHPSLSSFDGSTTPAGYFQPQAIAVDPSSGDTYVIDVANGVLDKFDSTGAPAEFSSLTSHRSEKR
jgi:hypothetical protein